MFKALGRLIIKGLKKLIVTHKDDVELILKAAAEKAVDKVISKIPDSQAKSEGSGAEGN